MVDEARLKRKDTKDEGKGFRRVVFKPMNIAAAYAELRAQKIAKRTHCKDCGKRIRSNAARCRHCYCDAGKNNRLEVKVSTAERQLEALEPALREAVERLMNRYTGGERDFVLRDTILMVKREAVCECADCRGLSLEERLRGDDFAI